MHWKRRHIGAARVVVALSAAFLLGMIIAPQLGAQAIGLPYLSKKSAECVECHKKQSRGLYQHWGESKHYRANVGCYECHAAEQSDKDAYRHYDRLIATVVSPKDCARCHPREVKEFADSHHSKGGRILGSLDNVLADTGGRPLTGHGAWLTSRGRRFPDAS